MTIKLFSYKTITILGAILLFLLSISNILNLSQIFVLHDEFGYWYNAANLAGYDWTGIKGISPYYSYGYSLILVPLFHIFNNSTSMFRAAILINGLFFTGSYVISCICAFRIFSKIRQEVLCLFCFFISCYGNFLFSINITWGEPLLTFLFWLIILTFLQFQKRNSLLYLIFLLVEALFLYSIHQRTLGVICAMLLTGTYIIKSTHISKKNLCVFSFISVCLIVFTFIFKNNLISSIWDSYISSDTGLANTYSGQAQKLINMFTSFDFFKAVTKGFFSKIFYLCCASGLLVLWGVFFIIHKFRNYRNESKIVLSIGIFCFLSTIFMEGISALYFNSTTRLDSIIYGRYAEFTVGPLLLFGLCFLYRNRDLFKTLVIGICIYLILSLPAAKALLYGSGNMYLSSVVGNIFYDSSSDRMNIGFLIVIPLMIGIFLYVFFQSPKRWLKIIAVIPLFCFWIYSSYYTLHVDVNPSQSQAAGYERFCNDIKKLGEDIPLYYVSRSEYGYNNSLIERVQSVLYDRKIQLIFPEDIGSLNGNYILIQYSSEDLNMENYTIYTQTHGLVAVVPNDSSLYTTAYQHQYNFSVFDPTDRINGTKPYSGRFDLTSDHTEGFLTYCNYLSLNSGTYEINLRIHAEEISNDFLGTFDVTYNYGENTLLQKNITADQIDQDGVANLTYTFNCEDINFCEFRLHVENTSYIMLDSLTYRRIQ